MKLPSSDELQLHGILACVITFSFCTMSNTFFLYGWWLFYNKAGFEYRPKLI